MAGSQAVYMAVEPGALQDTAYHLQQVDVDGVFTLLSGLVSVQMFSLVAQLLTLGVLLVVVLVVAIRRL